MSEKQGPSDQDRDYESGSPEDREHPAPTGKEARTEEDRELPEDQAAFQPDSEAS